MDGVLLCYMSVARCSMTLYQVTAVCCYCLLVVQCTAVDLADDTRVTEAQWSGSSAAHSSHQGFLPGA